MFGSGMICTTIPVSPVVCGGGFLLSAIMLIVAVRNLRQMITGCTVLLMLAILSSMAYISTGLLSGDFADLMAGLLMTALILLLTRGFLRWFRGVRP